MITEIETVEEYNAFTQNNGFAIVQFGFKWNSFDRTMMRTLIELEPEFAGKVALGFIDIDENGTIEVLRQINLVNVPTLTYFQNGEHITTVVGMRTMDDVRQKIQSLLQSEE